MIDINYEVYREHMSRYSRETAFMSFTVYKHPSFVILQEMGDRAIPFLFADLATVSENPDCYIGEIDTHAIMVLLHILLGDRAPRIPENERGRVRQMMKRYYDKGVELGYISIKPVEGTPWVKNCLKWMKRNAKKFVPSWSGKAD